MKNLIIVIIAAFIILPVLASADENSKYIIANGKVYYGNIIKAGLSNMTITTTNGEKVIIPNREVLEFSTGKEVYSLLPVDNYSDCEKVMMKFIARKQGLSLYEIHNKTCQYVHDCYRVFKNGKFYLKVSESNAKEILPYFGLRVL